MTPVDISAFNTKKETGIAGALTQKSLFKPLKSNVGEALPCLGGKHQCE